MCDSNSNSNISGRVTGIDAVVQEIKSLVGTAYKYSEKCEDKTVNGLIWHDESFSTFAEEYSDNLFGVLETYVLYNADRGENVMKLAVAETPVYRFADFIDGKSLRDRILDFIEPNSVDVLEELQISFGETNGIDTYGEGFSIPANIFDKAVKVFDEFFEKHPHHNTYGDVEGYGDFDQTADTFNDVFETHCSRAYGDIEAYNGLDGVPMVEFDRLAENLIEVVKDVPEERSGFVDNIQRFDVKLHLSAPSVTAIGDKRKPHLSLASVEPVKSNTEVVS